MTAADAPSTFEFLLALSHHLEEGETLAEALSHADDDSAPDPARVSQVEAHLAKMRAGNRAVLAGLQPDDGA